MPLFLVLMVLFAALAVVGFFLKAFLWLAILALVLAIVSGAFVLVARRAARAGRHTPR